MVYLYEWFNRNREWQKEDIINDLKRLSLKMKKFVIKIWPKFLWFIIEISSIIGGVILTNYLAIIKFSTQIFLKSPPKDEIYAIDLAINILISKALIFGIYSLLALLCQILFCSNEINLTFEDKNKNWR